MYQTRCVKWLRFRYHGSRYRHGHMEWKLKLYIHFIQKENGKRRRPRHNVIKYMREERK